MRTYVSLRAMFSYVGRYKAAFGLTALLYALANVIIALVPWLIGQLTDSLLARDDMIVWWTVVLIAASVVHDAFWRAGEIAYMQTIVTRSHRFDDEVFANVVQNEYGYFVDRYTGKISSYAASLGREFRELLDETFNQYLNIPVVIPILAATMFSVNTLTGIIFAGSICLMFIIGRLLARKAADAEGQEADEQSSLDGQLVDAVANFVTVKAFGSERREGQRLIELRHEVIKAARYSYFRSILFWGTMSLFIRWIIWPATFILNIYLYIQGDISLAQVTTFLAAIVVFTSTIWDVIWSVSQINIKLARTEEAYRYLFGERNIIRDRSAFEANTPTPAFANSLELRDMRFAYPDKPDVAVLQNINLTIKRGEKIGIVGPSGGGKSTLIKLLLGYYPVVEGSLRLDGQAVDSSHLNHLVAYVPQDTTIFHRSIRENIAYARPDASQADIINAAKHAQAHDFITGLDHGYDTKVGERGVKLSGGQRQRIAIARAILKDAPLLLLDEATSALDSESEKLIQRALSDLLHDRTALVIAHRLSTIQHLDRIIVIDGGRIVEAGDHASLLANGGLYARLWSHQTDGFIQD